MRRNRWLIVPLILILAACATAPGVQRTPLDTAKLAYVDASLGYEVAMQTLTSLRFQHVINDSQWDQVMVAQKSIQQTAPLVAAGLKAWESAGSKPATFDNILSDLVNALTTLQTIQKGAQP